MTLYKIIILSLIFQSMIIFNFTKDSTLSNWNIQDDVVMGGRSNGNFKLNADGFGEFSGEISLKNNGGFSSVKHSFKTVKSDAYSKFLILVKGDGKNYQFRVKKNDSQRYSYIYEFSTTTNWQTIEIPFSDMYASFRGNRLDLPNFEGEQMHEITFLIGNKKEETFKLLIDKITLQ